MKVSRKERVFCPITLTLECDSEVQALLSLTGNLTTAAIEKALKSNDYFRDKASIERAREIICEMFDEVYETNGERYREDL